MTAEARAGSAGLHLVSGVALLRPDEQVFTAMLDGWRNQQLARNLSFGTIESRQRIVQVFARHANGFPWQWSPQLFDEWCTDLRAARGLRRSTLRSYAETIRLFCGYVTDPVYGWPAECEQRFGTFPVQVCHEWECKVNGGKLARSASDGVGSPRRCELGLHRCFRVPGSCGTRWGHDKERR